MAGGIDVNSLTQKLGAGAGRRKEFARSCAAFLRTTARLLQVQGAMLSVVAGESELVLAGFGIRRPTSAITSSPGVTTVAAYLTGAKKAVRLCADEAEIPIRAEDGSAFSFYLGLPCPSAVGETSGEMVVLALLAAVPPEPSIEPSPEQIEALVEAAAEQIRQALLRLDYESFRRELRFSRLIRESTDDAIIVTEAESRDDEGPRIVYVNEAFVRMTGYQPAEVIGKSPRLLIGPGTDPVELERIGAAISAREPVRAELLNYRRNGTEFWVELNISPVTDEAGRHTHWVSIQRETTERRATEARLKDLAARLETALESTTDYVLIVDPNWRITYLNARAKEFIGPGRELIGADLWQAFPEAENLKFNEAYRRAMRDGAPVNVVDYYPPFEMWVDAHAYPSPTGLTIFARDVTQRNRLEQEMERAQKMEATGQFAGTIAHDFNNLLTVINGYTRMMLKRIRGDDPQRRDLEAICDAGERAVHLTRQLLAFGRQQVLRAEVVGLNEIITDLGTMMLPGLLHDDIELQTTLAPTLGDVKIDPLQFEQVILNLVINARDAMPDGGTLKIETAGVELDEEFAVLHPKVVPGRYSMLAVSDTGTGMTPEIQGRIFEPFFTTKPKGQGTGLGLPTVFGIVKQSGGYIAVESVPGRGSTFRVYLPTTEEPRAPAPAPPESVDPTVEWHGARAPNTETILVVEDDDRVRDFTVAALSSVGYLVFAAADGAEARQLSAALPNPLHLLLTDVVLPETTGRRLAEEVLREHAETTVLYMSGYTREALIAREEIEPKYGYLQKPFLPEALDTAVRAALGPVAPSRRRVMVVDDEAAVCDYLGRVISEAGYEVTTVGDGNKALRLFRQWPADLVLTDLVMPEMEGIETIQSLKRESPGLRIIAMSGAVSGPILTAAKHLGANEVLQKPVSADELVRLLKKLIG